MPLHLACYRDFGSDVITFWHVTVTFGRIWTVSVHDDYSFSYFYNFNYFVTFLIYYVSLSLFFLVMFYQNFTNFVSWCKWLFEHKTNKKLESAFPSFLVHTFGILGFILQGLVGILEISMDQLNVSRLTVGYLKGCGDIAVTLARGMSAVLTTNV